MCVILPCIYYFFYINHEISWGGPQLWEAPLSPYHNPDWKSPLEPGGTDSPNKGDFPVNLTVYIYHTYIIANELLTKYKQSKTNI